MTAPSKNGSIVRIPFTKASACGNDFLLVDGSHTTGDLAALKTIVGEVRSMLLPRG